MPNAFSNNIKPTLATNAKLRLPLNSAAGTAIQRISTALSAAFVLVSLCLLFTGYDKTGFLDSCAKDRFDLQTYAETRGSSNKSTWITSFRVTVASLLMSLGILCFASTSNKRWTVPRFNVFHVSFTVCWYYCSFSLCSFLKLFLVDTTCNKYANSISGHYHFVVFFMLSTVYLFSKLHLASNPVSHESPGQITPNVVWTVIQLAPLCILFVSGSLVLYETYAGGYHSFRQIIYGITLALCSFSLYLLALRSYDPRESNTMRQRLVTLCMWFLACNTAFLCYDQLVHQRALSRTVMVLLPSFVTLLFTVLVAPPPLTQ